MRIRIGSVFRSFLDPDPIIRTGIPNMYPDSHMQILDKMKAKDVDLRLIKNSETQLIKNFLR